VAGKEIAVKKYVVKVEREERERLEGIDPLGQEPGAVADEGAHPAEGGRVGGGRRLERQRDRGGAGHQHQQCRAHPAATRRGRFEATLKRKYNPNSARPRIFDGAAEAKLIALTCSPAPEGFARWSLRLLEEKVVELNIVEKASDNTIGRTLKKTLSTASQTAMGDSAGRQRRLRRRHGRRAGPTRGRMIPIVPSCVDETSKQLIAETRAPIPAKPGQARPTRLRIRAQRRRPICS
jgi:hypothetical protein